MSRWDTNRAGEKKQSRKEIQHAVEKQKKKNRGRYIAGEKPAGCIQAPEFSWSRKGAGRGFGRGHENIRGRSTNEVGWAETGPGGEAKKLKGRQLEWTHLKEILTLTCKQGTNEGENG